MYCVKRKEENERDPYSWNNLCWNARGLSIDNSHGDYCCADGALIRFLAPLFPEMTFIGYDKNEDMISRADAANIYENCLFYSQPYNFLPWIEAHNYTIDECALNLSSIIHEVYSYSSEEGIDDF